MESPQESAPALASRVGYSFVRAALRVRQLYAERLKEAGLLPNHHAILSLLNEQGGAHQKLLAERATLDPADIVGYLDVLQKAGYITRRRDPDDRRRQVVDITPAGRRVLAVADGALDRAEQQAFGDLDSRQRAQLVEISVEVYRAAGSAG